MIITANKFKGVRAAHISYPEEAIFAKADDNVNIISMAGDYISVNIAVNIIRNWLGTEFKGGRYQERIEMVEEIEKENMK